MPARIFGSLQTCSRRNKSSISHTQFGVEPDVKPTRGNILSRKRVIIRDWKAGPAREIGRATAVSATYQPGEATDVAAPEADERLVGEAVEGAVPEGEAETRDRSEEAKEEAALGLLLAERPLGVTEEEAKERSGWDDGEWSGRGGGEDGGVGRVVQVTGDGGGSGNGGGLGGPEGEVRRWKGTRMEEEKEETEEGDGAGLIL